jgi:hypothetical protein
MDPTAPAKPCLCSICNESFTSKTKLFKHLATHGYQGANTKPERAVLLIGWLADYLPDNDKWIGESGLNVGAKEAVLDNVETSLYKALYALESDLASVNDIAPDVLIERPKGSSRCSSISQRSAFLLS